MSQSTLPAPNRDKKTPIVLGHAACTGGSLIYRIIVATFDLLGLNEVGIPRVSAINQFHPGDPEYQLFAQEKISAFDFSEIVFNRVTACEQRSETRLLVREHSHSFFFNTPDPAIVPSGGAWFSDLYQQRYSVQLPCLVSVRNPVDSWLGFRRNFPHQSPVEFDEYCRLYCEYLQKIDTQNAELGCFLVFKYEDLIDEPQRVIDQIADHIGEARKPADLSLVGKRLGSGNSGRVSTELVQRSRRPFSRKFVNEAEQSVHYSNLCARLGYPKISDEITLVGGLRADYYSLVSGLSSLSKFLHATPGWVRETVKTGKNLQ